VGFKSVVYFEGGVLVSNRPVHGLRWTNVVDTTFPVIGGKKGILLYLGFKIEDLFKSSKNIQS